MIGYSSIIGLFGFLDRDQWVGDSQVRSANFIFFVFGFAKHRSLTLVPLVEPLNCPFESVHRGPFEAVECVQRSCFVGQAAKCERLEHDLGFGGMDEALAVDFLSHDAGFQKDDAHAFLMRVEDGLQ